MSVEVIFIPADSAQEIRRLPIVGDSPEQRRRSVLTAIGAAYAEEDKDWLRWRVRDSTNLRIYCLDPTLRIGPEVDTENARATAYLESGGPVMGDAILCAVDLDRNDIRHTPECFGF